MDSFIQKFGIFDFLGIWGPGAITVTYFLFTLYDGTSTVLKQLKIDQIHLSQGYMIVLLYTAVAYFLGVILHELGKMLWWSSPDKIKNKIINKEYSIFCPIRKIEEENITAIESTIEYNAFSTTSFDKAISVLKYNNNINTKRIDLHHSAFAFSRSMFWCFFVHFWTTLLSYVFINPNLCVLIIMCFMDIFIMYILGIRTYRYYFSWIRNCYLQYFVASNNLKLP